MKIDKVFFIFLAVFFLSTSTYSYEPGRATRSSDVLESCSVGAAGGSTGACYVHYQRKEVVVVQVENLVLNGAQPAWKFSFKLKYKNTNGTSTVVPDTSYTIPDVVDGVDFSDGIDATEYPILELQILENLKNTLNSNLNGIDSLSAGVDSAAKKLIITKDSGLVWIEPITTTNSGISRPFLGVYNREIHARYGSTAPFFCPSNVCEFYLQFANDPKDEKKKCNNGAYKISKPASTDIGANAAMYAMLYGAAMSDRPVVVTADSNCFVTAVRLVETVVRDFK